jgi:hypothetical protein
VNLENCDSILGKDYEYKDSIESFSKLASLFLFSLPPSFRHIDLSNTFSQHNTNNASHQQTSLLIQTSLLNDGRKQAQEKEDQAHPPDTELFDASRSGAHTPKKKKKSRSKRRMAVVFFSDGLD